MRPVDFRREVNTFTCPFFALPLK